MPFTITSILLFLTLAMAGLLLAGFAYEERSRRNDLRRYPPLGRLIDIGGRRLHLLSKGTGTPTVVIEQGAGGPSLCWLRLQEEVAEFAQVCIYDRAGYGWSDPAAGTRSVESRVDDLHSLLTKAEIPGPWVLVAHCYGGFLMRLFAREYPHSVAGLVLVDTPHESVYFQPEVLDLYSKLSLKWRGMGLLSRVGLARILAKPDPKLPPEMRAQITPSIVRHEYFSAASDDLNSFRRTAARLMEKGALGTLGDIPVAVITHGQPFHGRFRRLEKWWEDGQKRLMELSTNSLLFRAENANHMIHNDEPEVVVEAIRSVLSRAGHPSLISQSDSQRVK